MAAGTGDKAACGETGACEESDILPGS